MRTFQHVILPTLEDAYTAWGLDLVWPVLLGFPRDKIAVIDGAQYRGILPTTDDTHTHTHARTCDTSDTH